MNTHEVREQAGRLAAKVVALLGALLLSVLVESNASESIGELPTLPDLQLTKEEVTEDAIEQLSGLHWGTVTLADATFTGTIIERLRHVGSIRDLRLFGTGLSGQIPRLEHVTGLTGLEIGTPLLGRDLEAIGRLVNLERLSLPKDFIVNVTGAREIARLVNLKSLRLYHVDIDDASFLELRTLVKLEELDLSHTRITDKGLVVLGQLPNLKKLELYRHPEWYITQQLTDEGVVWIAGRTGLERLSLSGKITDQGLAKIAQLPRLKSLSILATETTPAGLVALVDSAVENLTLTPYHLGGVPSSGADYLKKCRQLKYLTVIGDTSPLDDFEKLTQELPEVSVSFIDP